jgi:hypothetical protein
MDIREQLAAMGHPDLLGIIAEVDPELHELLLDPAKVEALIDESEDES